MADVTVNYKGSAIAELSATGTTTLETGGTFCEGDIEVAYVKPGGSSDIKMWTYTHGSSTSYSTLVTVATDPWIASNYNNNNLTIVVRRIGDVSAVSNKNGILLLISSNTVISNMWSDSYSVCFSINSNGNQQYDRGGKKPSSSPDAYSSNVYVDSSGNIKLFHGQILANSEFCITAYLMKTS